MLKSLKDEKKRSYRSFKILYSNGSQKWVGKPETVLQNTMEGGFILQQCFQDKYGLLYRLIQWKPEMSSETRNRITNFFLTVTNKIFKFKYHL